MSRPLRVEFAGACYHVINRGNYRRNLFTAAGDLPDSPAGWKKYLDYLEFLATDDAARRELVTEKMSRGWCLGDKLFKADMKAVAAEQGADLERFGGLEPPAVRQERVER